MMTLTSSNYYGIEANRDYWSVSQYKAFDRCEAAGLAMVNGQYEREETTALLVGSFVDEFFTGDVNTFIAEHPQILKKDGTLKSDYLRAETMIERVQQSELMLDYLKGEHQVIMSAELFDVPWKIKIDVHGGNRIVDLKTVKDFNEIYQTGFGYRSWIEYWGYDIQGAIYQRVEQLYSGRTDPLPFYIVAVTKEVVPDIAVIHLPQNILNAALKVVESKIDRFDLVKHGELPPARCERCDWCKISKVLTAPEEFEIKEA